MILLYVKSALFSLWSTKLRSILTAMGVTIGVALFICLVSLGNGAKKQILGQIDTLGSDVVYAVSAKKFILSNFDAATLTTKDVQTIASTKGVARMAPVRYLAGPIRAGEKATEPNLVVATNPNYQKIRGTKVAVGSFISQEDDRRGARVGVIGPETARKLFGTTNAVGKTIVFENTSIKVIGVFAPATPGSELTIGGGFDNVLFVPLGAIPGTLQQQLSVVIAKLEPTADKSNVKKILTQSILKNHSNNENFSVIANEDLLATSSNVLSILTKLIAIISAASLFIGGVGIMNIMLVTVTERTREIGIRKSMGATPRNIVMQFLTESILLSIFGGVIGIGLALVSTKIIGTLFDVQALLTLQLLVSGFFISVFIGILFGISPAIRASRMSPARAIRSE